MEGLIVGDYGPNETWFVVNPSTRPYKIGGWVDAEAALVAYRFMSEMWYSAKNPKLLIPLELL